MNFIRQPAVAGMFYPDHPQELRKELEAYLKNSCLEKAPKAMVVPHAGTIYSGPIGAQAYQTLRSKAEQIKTVILLGPAHRVALEGIAASSASHFKTPLGDIPVDQEKISLIQNSYVGILDQAHEEEHSLEVQLPFLQLVLKSFSIVPLVVGETTPEIVAQVLEKLWGGPETLIVISSDLSHYLDYKTAQILDRDCADKIEHFDWKHLDHEQACGYFPLRGLLYEAQKKKMKSKTIDLRNSGDTAGDQDRVVGYGSFLFYESS